MADWFSYSELVRLHVMTGSELLFLLDVVRVKRMLVRALSILDFGGRVRILTFATKLNAEVLEKSDLLTLRPAFRNFRALLNASV